MYLRQMAGVRLSYSYSYLFKSGRLDCCVVTFFNGAHSQNDKIDIRNYVEGTKALAAYPYRVRRFTCCTLGLLHIKIH